MAPIGKQIQEEQTVNHPERMIGDDEEGSLLRDVTGMPGVDARLDIKDREGARTEALFRTRSCRPDVGASNRCQLQRVRQDG